MVLSARWRLLLPVGAATAAVALVGLVPAASGQTSTPPVTGSSTGTTASSGGPDLSRPQTSAEGVEVRTHGTVTVHPYQDTENAPVVLAVHGVQRVPGATVVYYSAGVASGELEVAGMSELAAEQLGAAYIGGGVGSVRVVDTVGGNVYSTVLDPQSPERLPSPFHSPASAAADEPGTMGVMFAVLPELPVDLETVDVDLLFGVTIPQVPVGEGYLQPALDPDEVIPLGTGWPAVDEAAVAQVAEPDRFVAPLSAVEEALDASQAVTQTGKTVVIDVSADVLFAFDAATLSPKARATLTEVARRIAADGATGEVTVVGHTSAEGADDYNLTLSRQRATSAASVLRAALSGQSLTFAVDGRGETEPVADNGSEQGRELNRRVAVTYTKGS